MTSVLMIAAVAALVLVCAGTWLFREREVGTLRTACTEEKTRSAELVVQLSKCEASLSESRSALAAANERACALQDRLQYERENFERQQGGLEQKMAGQFAGLAQQALDGVSRSFLELAAAKLGEERQVLAGSLGARVEEIKGVMNPVRDEFNKFSAAVATMEKSSADKLGALHGSIDQVVRMQSALQDAVRTTNDTTGQLRNALQNPRVAGNWGEISLDRIVELGGMNEHCDFDRQVGVRSTDGTSERPDMIVRLTDGLCIPVDAKAASANYVRAAGESDDMERQRLLKQSALDIKSRITELRGRNYDRIEGYAGMTILFVPNESMLSSAMSLEPNLIEDALRDKIVICSPLLLLCYLRAFANGWRIAQQQDNAEEVARRGRMLHDRLQSFFGAVGKVGWYLNHTVEKFNIAVGKMDNLLVPGRELGRLLAKNDELTPVNTVDTAIRPVRLGDTTVSDAEPALARGSG